MTELIYDDFSGWPTTKFSATHDDWVNIPGEWGLFGTAVDTVDGEAPEFGSYEFQQLSNERLQITKPGSQWGHSVLAPQAGGEPVAGDGWVELLLRFTPISGWGSDHRHVIYLTQGSIDDVVDGSKGFQYPTQDYLKLAIGNTASHCQLNYIDNNGNDQIHGTMGIPLIDGGTTSPVWLRARFEDGVFKWKGWVASGSEPADWQTERTIVKPYPNPVMGLSAHFDTNPIYNEAYIFTAGQPRSLLYSDKGMVVVEHGDDADTPRPPGAGAVYWIGSVTPANRELHDVVDEEDTFPAFPYRQFVTTGDGPIESSGWMGGGNHDEYIRTLSTGGFAGEGTFDAIDVPFDVKYTINTRSETGEGQTVVKADGDTLDTFNYSDTDWHEWSVVAPAGTEVITYEWDDGGSGTGGIWFALFGHEPDNPLDIEDGMVFVDLNSTKWRAKNDGSEVTFVALNTGGGAVANPVSGLAIGPDSAAWVESISVGFRSEARGGRSVAIGSGAIASGSRSVSINTPTVEGTESIGIIGEVYGSGVMIGGGYIDGEDSVGIGHGWLDSPNSIGIGWNYYVDWQLDGAISIGHDTYVAHDLSVALGAGVSTTAERQVAVGDRDIEIDPADPSTENRGLIMRSPDGTRWRLTVDNSGNPVFTSL